MDTTRSTDRPTIDQQARASALRAGITASSREAMAGALRYALERAATWTDITIERDKSTDRITMIDNGRCEQPTLDPLCRAVEMRTDGHRERINDTERGGRSGSGG